MARASGTITRSSGSAAAYKGYYQPISTALNAVLARTADTGQVNWAAVASEPTVTRDYEVFGFADPLQATAPIFARFDYQGGTTTNQCRVTVGTTTDGAGNVGGLSVPAATLNTFSPTANDTRSVYASTLDGSQLVLLYGIGAGTAADGMAALVIERTRNADGTANGNGFMVYRWKATSPTANTFDGISNRVYGAGTQPGDDWTINMVVPLLRLAGNTFVEGATAYAYPAYGQAGRVPQGASKALLLAPAGDFPRNQEVSVTHYGQLGTWVPAGSAGYANVPLMNTAGTLTNVALYPIFRWE